MASAAAAVAVAAAAAAAAAGSTPVGLSGERLSLLEGPRRASRPPQETRTGR